MSDRFALDTNILIFIHDEQDTLKRTKAIELISSFPVISTQVISEYINVLKRRLFVPKDELLVKCAEWLQYGEIYPVGISTIKNAIPLVKRYDFQVFDALIVSSAIDAGCTILYSEDMQHGQLIENQLRIINPFL